MATISHEQETVRERRRWSELLVSEMWASLAIAIIWLSVLFTAIFGPNIETRSVAGDSSTWPSVVVVALFALLATWIVARHGFRRDPKE
jgi:protein-S-isoprenylcysteine O-methyltransferase Ste14